MTPAVSGRNTGLNTRHVPLLIRCRPMMRRFSGSATPAAPIALVLAVLATLLVPAVAQATTKQYVLPHPKREHCRAHRAPTRSHGGALWEHVGGGRP